MNLNGSIRRKLQFFIFAEIEGNTLSDKKMSDKRDEIFWR